MFIKFAYTCSWFIISLLGYAFWANWWRSKGLKSYFCDYLLYKYYVPIFRYKDKNLSELNNLLLTSLLIYFISDGLLSTSCALLSISCSLLSISYGLLFISYVLLLISYGWLSTSLSSYEFVSNFYIFLSFLWFWILLLLKMYYLLGIILSYFYAEYFGLSLLLNTLRH